jgi:hypothetical protein
MTDNSYSQYADKGVCFSRLGATNGMHVAPEKVADSHITFAPLQY